VLGASLVDQGTPPEVPDWAALAGLWPAILGLVAVGSRLQARGEGQGAAGPLWPFLVGLAGIVPFFLVVLPAEAGGPLALSLVALVVGGLAYGWIVARVTGGKVALIGWMGLGWYVQSAFFSAFHIFPISPVSVVVNMVVLGVLFAMTRRTSR
jgi:hypothetical protein